MRTLAVVAIAGVLGGTAAAPHDPPLRREASARATYYQGETIKWWARHAVAARRDANERLAVIRAQRSGYMREVWPKYEHAAVLAAIAYAVDAETLIRKGRCESVNWTQFTNAKSGAEGPWQFLPSTWRTTPFATFSPYDPDAAALAAAWMHSPQVHRGDEWVCP